MNEEQQYINFDEYVKASEPHKRERAEAWRVAIGLQAVDGLQTSEYLQETARRNIEGEITIDEARELVKQYYVTKTARDADDANKEEADKVSSTIYRKCSRPMPFLLVSQGLLQYIDPSSKVYSSMQDVSVITISRKRNGYCEVKV